VRCTLGSLLLPEFWSRSLQPSQVYGWYFDRLNLLMKENDQVVLVAHSAGGWLARWYVSVVGDAECPQILRLICLGTPQSSSPDAQADQTRGVLKWIETTLPGNYVDGLDYISVAGRSIQGQPQSSSREEQIAFQSYEALCGDGTVWGDGIVPLPNMFLSGATNITIDGAKHSPLSSKTQWYGAPEKLSLWIHIIDTAEEPSNYTRASSRAL